jgi:choline dehydrogenase-like flavoprotein
MGVSTEHIRHNHGNEVLLEGSRKLGYHAKAVPQNTGGSRHECGHCTLGCGAAQKQGPVVSWLPDAAKAGAKFVEGYKVDRVIFDESNGKKKAVGIEGVWTSRNSNGGVDGPLSGRTIRKVIVRAKKVIISCGTLWSPIVLLNSGLKVSQCFEKVWNHTEMFRTGKSVAIFTCILSISSLGSIRRIFDPGRVRHIFPSQVVAY